MLNLSPVYKADTKPLNHLSPGVYPKTKLLLQWIHYQCNMHHNI